MTVTLNAALLPDVTVRLSGCAVMVGAIGAGFTVTIATELVMEPTELVMTTA